MVSWISAIDRQRVSDLSGTFSFVIWLFAQSPQLYENYRRGSVDGLSPVFLTQWMLGDATNLIGCILTQQLPFQIAVATYFCCIDVCIMGQFAYYWSKARRERARRTKGRSRQRANSLTISYPANPYSVLSETSELLGGRSSRHNSYLHSTSRRRNLSHSQQLTHPHRQHHDPHAPTIPHPTSDKPEDAPQIESTHSRHTHASSRSRSRHLPSLSRRGSTDTTAAGGSASVANYRALSEAALSVAQLAQEAARRREVLLHHAHLTDEDYFSHRRPRSHRSKSHASSSPLHSQSPSRSRSRVNSNDPSRPEAHHADLAASTQSPSGPNDANSSAVRRSRATRSMSARRNAVAGNVDFVPSALSPTRESKDLDDQGHATQATPAGTSEETEAESEYEASSGPQDDAAAASMADSIASLATVSTDCSADSSALEPRGRDMVRTANRIESDPVSGDATPAVTAAMSRQATASPFASNSSSDGTARHASPQPTSRGSSTHRMSMSHHQLGQHDREDDDERGEVARAVEHGLLKSRKRRARESSPLHHSAHTLTPTESGKRTMTRSTSSKSISKRLVTRHGHAESLMALTSSTSSAGPGASGSKKRSGTKSPASMRRSIGMVLLGIMLISSLPPTSTTASAAAVGSIPAASDLPIGVALFAPLDGGMSASWRRLVGRISAWLCALLYITSRIPQIWENHLRRSVAGLSILLFVAAFTGNLFYTVSVLVNPAAHGDGARLYLQESLPFLLGSGGTLVFDLIIVAQWLAWRDNAIEL